MNDQHGACDCRVQLAARLARTFEPEWTVSSLMDLHHVGAWLDISPEDTRTLIHTGLLQSDDAENVRVGDLVAFVEETNWLRLRAEQNFEHLRAYAMAVNESPEKERTDA